MSNSLSKDELFRDFSLRANMWRVVFHVCGPLALFDCLNQLFKILDSMMAAHISAESVSAVVYLGQINMMISALGGGLAVGSSIKISEAYGAGDYPLVKKRTNTLFAICGVLGGVVLLGILPFTGAFLRLAGTPEELIAIGSRYFVIDLFSIVLGFFLNVYISVERARGNSKRILWFNLASVSLKLSLTALFVYGMDGGVTSISVASLISQVAVLVYAVIVLKKSDSAFSLSLKEASFKREVTAPMLKLSFPVMVEKAAFSLGKVLVNSMSTDYGTLTVGTLGISNTIGGITTSPQGGFQSGAAAIISQNRGAGKPKRSLEAFKCVLIINMVIGAVGCCLTLVFLPQISRFFAGEDSAFAQLIASVYRYEAWGGFFLGINASVVALLYGFGYTKLTLLINFCRIFLFRVPVLWGLQRFTTLGSESVGVVMMVSNVLTGLLAVVVGTLIVRKICIENGVRFFGKEATPKEDTATV